MVDGITQQKLEEIGYGVSDHYYDRLTEYVWELEEIDGLKVPQIEARFTYVGDVFNENLQFDPNLYDEWQGYKDKVVEEEQNKDFREGIEEELIEIKLNEGEYLLYGDHEYDQWVVEKLIDEGILKLKDDDKKGVWVEEIKQNVLIPQFEIDEKKEDELQEFIDSNYDSLRQMFEYTGYIKSEKEILEGRSLKEEFIRDITGEEPYWSTHDQAYDTWQDKAWYFLGPANLIDVEEPVIFLSTEYSGHTPFRVVDPEIFQFELFSSDNKYEDDYIQEINQELEDAFKREETKLKKWSGDIKDFKDFEKRQMRFSPTVAGSQPDVSDVLDKHGIAITDNPNLWFTSAKKIFDEAEEHLRFIEDSEKLKNWIDDSNYRPRKVFK